MDLISDASLKESLERPKKDIGDKIVRLLKEGLEKEREDRVW